MWGYMPSGCFSHMVSPSQWSQFHLIRRDWAAAYSPSLGAAVHRYSIGWPPTPDGVITATLASLLPCAVDCCCCGAGMDLSTPFQLHSSSHSDSTVLIVWDSDRMYGIGMDLSTPFQWIGRFPPFCGLRWCSPLSNPNQIHSPLSIYGLGRRGPFFLKRMGRGAPDPCLLSFRAP